MKTMFRPAGRMRVECFDPATGAVLWEETIRNMSTLEGMTCLFDVGFDGGTQEPAWHLGLISNSGFVEVAEDDTMASHGWTEATAYSGDRPQWTPLAIAAGIATNSSNVVYIFTGAAVLKGIFVVSVATKGGTTGVLWATALFGATRTLAAGNGLRVTYTVTASGGNA